MNKDIAIITIFGHVGISNPLINTVKFFVKRGYNVDLYMDHASENQSLVNYNKDAVKVINSNIQSKLVFRDIIFYKNIFNKNKRYRFIIGFEPQGLVRAGIINLFTGIPFFFHSIELYELNKRDAYKGWNLEIPIKGAIAATRPTIRHYFNRILEIYFNQKAILSFIQSPMRAKILANQHKINRKKVKVVYNSPIGNIITEKSDYFRKKYSIPNEKKLVLLAGSMIYEHFIDEIVKSVDTWPDDYILILHGWFPDKIFHQAILKEIKKRENRIVLSLELLSEDKHNLIFQSVDFGLVFFRPVNNNMRYGNSAAGKLYHFLRMGVPVISNRNPGMKKFIDKTGFGITVANPHEIGTAIEVIYRDYNLFSETAFSTYYKYEFEECFSALMDKYLI